MARQDDEKRRRELEERMRGEAEAQPTAEASTEAPGQQAAPQDEAPGLQAAPRDEAPGSREDAELPGVAAGLAEAPTGPPALPK